MKTFWKAFAWLSIPLMWSPFFWWQFIIKLEEGMSSGGGEYVKFGLSDGSFLLFFLHFVLVAVVTFQWRKEL